MLWGHDGDPLPALWHHEPVKRAVVSWCRNHGYDVQDVPRIGKKAAAATPPEFAEALLEIARAAHG